MRPGPSSLSALRPSTRQRSCRRRVSTDDVMCTAGARRRQFSARRRRQFSARRRRQFRTATASILRTATASIPMASSRADDPAVSAPRRSGQSSRTRATSARWRARDWVERVEPTAAAARRRVARVRKAASPEARRTGRCPLVGCRLEACRPARRPVPSPVGNAPAGCCSDASTIVREEFTVRPLIDSTKRAWHSQRVLCKIRSARRRRVGPGRVAGAGRDEAPPSSSARAVIGRRHAPDIGGDVGSLRGARTLAARWRRDGASPPTGA